jgi:hypothetical protein
MLEKVSIDKGIKVEMICSSSNRMIDIRCTQLNLSTSEARHFLRLNQQGVLSMVPENEMWLRCPGAQTVSSFLPSRLCTKCLKFQKRSYAKSIQRIRSATPRVSSRGSLVSLSSRSSSIRFRNRHSPLRLT